MLAGMKVDRFCPLCKKMFATKDYCRNHMKIHEGEIPHKCKVCGLTMSSGSSLRRHLTIHDNQRPFKCTICKCSFSTKFNLQRHIGIHCQEKFFRCSICGRWLPSNYCLKMHLKSHVNNKLQNCFWYQGQHSTQGNTFQGGANSDTDNNSTVLETQSQKSNQELEGLLELNTDDDDDDGDQNLGTCILEDVSVSDEQLKIVNSTEEYKGDVSSLGINGNVTCRSLLNSYSPDVKSQGMMGKEKDCFSYNNNNLKESNSYIPDMNSQGMMGKEKDCFSYNNNNSKEINSYIPDVNSQGMMGKEKDCFSYINNNSKESNSYIPDMNHKMSSRREKDCFSYNKDYSMEIKTEIEDHSPPQNVTESQNEDEKLTLFDGLKREDCDRYLLYDDYSKNSNADEKVECHDGNATSAARTSFEWNSDIMLLRSDKLSPNHGIDTSSKLRKYKGMQSWPLVVGTLGIGEDNAGRNDERNRFQNFGQTFGRGRHDVQTSTREDPHSKQPEHKKSCYLCPFCKKSFAGFFYFRNHMECHFKELPHECSLCHQVFTTKYSVLLHMVTHM